MRQKARSSFQFICVALILCALSAMAQSGWQPEHKGIGFAQTHSKQWVRMVSSPELTMQADPSEGKRKSPRAGKTGNADLRFVISPGLHVNSHTPNSHYLIATDLALEAPAGVQIRSIEYPQGVNYHLQFAPKEALSVYTGEFGVLVHVAARPGHYVLHGKLRYQACDNQACNPPNTLPLTLDLTAE